VTPPAAAMPAALVPRMRDGPRGRVNGGAVAALGAAGLAGTAGAVYLTAVSNHAPNPAGHAVLTAAACLLFVGTALLALRRPPYVRFGLILAAVGFSSLLGSLHDANGAVPYTIGVLTSNLVFAVLLHALLAFHHGHLASRTRRVIAAAGYVDVLVLQAVAVLFDPLTRWHSNHPRNAALLASHASLATALEELEAAIAALLVVASLLVLSRRAVAATPAARRQLLPILVAGKLALVSFAVGLALAPLSSDAAVVGIGVGMVASLGVPAAFLGILVQGRLSRAAVGELLVELRDPGEPPELRDALRRALGDPTLELVRVRAGDGAYVDPHGCAVTLPAHGEPQMATRIFHQGEPVGALVHDRSLRLRPELLDAVSAAAGFALANELALQSVQQIERRNRALLDAIPDPMIRVTRDGTYLDVRDDHCELLHPVDELLGRNVREMLPEELTGRVLDCVERTLDEGGIRTLEYEIEVDGELRWKESRMVAGGGGDVVTIVRDFTEQRRAEAAQRRLADEQAALRRVATLVAGDAAPEEVFQAVTAEVCGVLGIRSALLLRYEQGETATIVGRFGAPTDDFLVGSPLVLEAGAARTVLRTGASVQIDYDELDGSLAERMRALGFRWSVGVPINVAGCCWGALITAFRDSEPFPPETETRLRAFAELVGLAVASADARDELAASRLRIVEASDAERRRIERNLHDGAQQRLVGLSVGLRLARRKLRESPDEAEELLDLAGQELSDALTELRELAQGIHPAVLTERGLSEALEVLAARTPLPVALDVQLDDRLPEPVEAAAYYVVSEALANVVKHAGANAASVRIARRNGSAAIEVTDDGAGGADPEAGTGLWGLRDRVETLDGRLEIASEPGCGTLVTARIPLP
jgi:PAS domain S-box-containing protein